MTSTQALDHGMQGLGSEELEPASFSSPALLAGDDRQEDVRSAQVA
eukprot:CAMPEP_0113717190 /NCGR_PEP_ID=MMETSP0038_2-20120614/34363_1 /TAXON_ID=2898 /ORGANISM="Cryptomonas paramecium" /LENGTH=45 /DNA_ID=CAMNT_0000644907 /DNA_START=102 /DNA_END=235 /DNA_ORIENTATION=+ /assembly_acc=CAM_ASM_000170